MAEADRSTPPIVPHRPIGRLDAEEWSALGTMPLVFLDLSDASTAAIAEQLSGRTEAVVIGFDNTGNCPDRDDRHFDCLLTVQPRPPAPWVGVAATGMGSAGASIGRNVAAAPLAAAVLTRVLRINEGLPVGDGLAVESLAYSTLLASSEFARWLAHRRVSEPSQGSDRPTVAYARDANTVTLTLASPETRNAMSAPMRDALFEALAAVADDPSLPQLVLIGQGRCFSVGGDLSEFGTANDMAMAHAVRTARSATRLIAELGSRAGVRVYGACIGSGCEIAAAAAERIAAPGSFFQLPELTMGLIPGAGGTVSVTRAIGRHRTTWMVLSGRRISAATALEWGLIHAIGPR